MLCFPYQLPYSMRCSRLFLSTQVGQDTTSTYTRTLELVALYTHFCILVTGVPQQVAVFNDLDGQGVVSVC